MEFIEITNKETGAKFRAFRPGSSMEDYVVEQGYANSILGALPTIQQVVHPRSLGKVMRVWMGEKKKRVMKNCP